MDWFIPLAVKSFLIAGGALLLLKLLKTRSAADRSWIAHLALAGLLLLPVATFAFPTLDVAGPEFLVGKAEVVSPSSVQLPAAPVTEISSAPLAVDAGVGNAATVVDWPFWAYFAPSALLFLLTLIALVRLFVLKARATVMVDAPWLTALARAQQRMGFKHGTALLTSNELPSPISWGVVRPVILLNTEAAESHEEAEAIITHELAHVAHLDWAKLLLSRVTVALFWFNPFVWLLAREAHQLREEAADDAVLATDIEDTDYARLLVGVARHECRGLLIGAHGVAPARNSLARRVKRVLDGAAKRAPGGWRWGSAAAFFAAGMAVPVAALNLVPVAPASADLQSDASYYADSKNAAGPALANVPDEIANRIGAASAVAGGAAVGTGVEASQILSRSVAPNGATVTTTDDGMTVARAPNGATVKMYPPDQHGRRRVVAVGPNGAIAESYADARGLPGLASAIAHPHPGGMVPRPRNRDSAIDRAIEMKAVGVSPEYIAAMRSVVPQLGLESDDIIAMRAVGVTPEFVRELARLGYRNLDADEITGAYAVGVRADYVRSLAAAGYGRISLDNLTELRAVGVTASDIERFRRAGYPNLTVDKLVELKALGITPEELKASERHGP
ncbi:MAG: M56 family metallopeptidase [Sphingomonas sp.]|nr:M56 family metallopeptidase [Sphingomonas sp.]